MKTVRAVEEALAKVVAGWSGMAYGTAFFRGQIPDGGTGAALVLGAELPEENGDVSLPRFSSQVVAKFAGTNARQSAQGLLDVLRTNLPAFGVTQDGIVFPVILKRGEGAVVPDQDNGVKVYRMYYNMLVRFRDE